MPSEVIFGTQWCGTKPTSINSLLLLMLQLTSCRCKYLFLLYDDSFLRNQNYIFTTEGHPLPIRSTWHEKFPATHFPRNWTFVKVPFLLSDYVPFGGVWFQECGDPSHSRSHFCLVCRMVWVDPSLPHPLEAHGYFNNEEYSSHQNSQDYFMMNHSIQVLVL